MRHLFESILHLTVDQPFEREIAPGVSVRIRRLPPSLTWTGVSPLGALGERVHDAWNVLRGKAHASANPTLEQRLCNQNIHRRAA